MYRIKKRVKEKLKEKKITNRKIAKITGVTEGYISQIVNARRLDISKTMAYSFCKAIDSELEITDLFENF